MKLNINIKCVSNVLIQICQILNIVKYIDQEKNVSNQTVKSLL